MKRWYPNMPRYTTAIIIYKSRYGPATGRGTSNVNTNIVRVLKRSDITEASRLAAPTQAPPSDNTAQPESWATGWTAWWPAPPSHTVGYKIPDPPTMERPIDPTPDDPILWEAASTVGDVSWNLSIAAFYAMVEWKPKSASQKMSGFIEIERDIAVLKLRPDIVSTTRLNSKDWAINRVEDNSHWRITGTTPSFRRGEFVEVTAERTEF